MITFASARERNHSRSRHSSRNLALKLSVAPFCQGLPGSINGVPMPCAATHDSSALDTNSGPLLCMPRSGVGANYLRCCGSDEPHMSGFSRDLRALLAGRLDLLTFIYRCNSPRRKRWFCLIGIPLALGQPAGVAVR